MEKIAVPAIKERDLTIETVIISTEPGNRSIVLVCQVNYLDNDGKITSGAEMRISFKANTLYVKDDKYYSKFDKAWNYLISDPDTFYNHARNMVKEALEQQDKVDEGTYCGSNRVPDPEPFDMENLTAEQKNRIRKALTRQQAGTGAKKPPVIPARVETETPKGAGK